MQSKKGTDMQIGVLAFLTEQSGEPGAIAHEAENLGFGSFWVRLAKEAGRNPDALEFSVLLLNSADAGLNAEVLKNYQETGVSRVIVAARQAAFGSGTEAIKKLAPIVEQAQHV